MPDTSKTSALFGEPPAGQPVTASETEQAQPNTQQPDLSTLINQALEKSLPDHIGKALEKHSRSQQSQRDQMESRITKRLSDTLATLKASGVEITNDLQSAIHQQVTREENNQPLSQSSAQPQGTAQPEAGMKFDKFALRDEVFDLYGVKLEAATTPPN
jgi:hypothetical protein